MSLRAALLANRLETLAKAMDAAALCLSTPAWVSAPSPTCHPPSLSQQVSPATQQMQPTQTIQPPQPTGGRRRRVVDEDPDERRRKFLERNRAAATRCRQKRKVWVMSLEKKAEELTQTNMQLQVQPLPLSSALKGPVCRWHFLSQPSVGCPSSNTTHQPPEQLQAPSASSIHSGLWGGQ